MLRFIPFIFSSSLLSQKGEGGINKLFTKCFPDSCTDLNFCVSSGRSDLSAEEPPFGFQRQPVLLLSAQVSETYIYIGGKNPNLLKWASGA